MKLAITALAIASLWAGVASAQTDSYAQAKAKADADEAALPSPDRQALMAAQSATVDQGIAACATPNPDMTAFTVVAELDAAGRVVRTWREGGTPLAICFQKQLANRVLSKPPRAPFFTSFELSFTP
ncbi:hypothetical protein [Pseudoxanthomonas sp. UTMC 1351]|uniref:hypothetical protein n=1 Tax=Pseudoxanthomonas sp. UTMC 1351 TaxID=2695853 RepID=UPI0034CEF2BD